MQSTMLPISVTNQIDKIDRDFLWGDVDTSSHWNVVCQAKDRGGLGLRQTRLMNSALLAKQGWKVANNSNIPWCPRLSMSSSQYMEKHS